MKTVGSDGTAIRPVDANDEFQKNIFISKAWIFDLRDINHCVTIKIDSIYYQELTDSELTLPCLSIS